MRIEMVEQDIDEVIVSEEQIDARLEELAREVEEHYADCDKDLLLVGVLKGATYVMTDFSRKLQIHTETDWMSLSSYGSGTRSSGVVRVLKDLSSDVKGRDILIVEDVLDSGLTLGWLVQNLKSRGAKSVEIIALLRKPTVEGKDSRATPRWVGFEIPNKFVVGYGLDYAERYRTLPFVAVLSEHVYQ
jgi:hypoxanthine phosphoribosyltransferase